MKQIKYPYAAAFSQPASSFCPRIMRFAQNSSLPPPSLKCQHLASQVGRVSPECMRANTQQSGERHKDSDTHAHTHTTHSGSLTLSPSLLTLQTLAVRSVKSRCCCIYSLPERLLFKASCERWICKFTGMRRQDNQQGRPS